jgi:hypothetical protein
MRKTLAALAFLALSLVSVADAQVVPCDLFPCSLGVHFLSASSTNATSVTARQTALYNVITVNTTASIYYLKLYDKASAPTCGTDTPIATYPVPFGASSSGGGFQMSRGTALGFSLGMGFCLTSGIADADTGVAVTGIAINFEYR